MRHAIFWMIALANPLAAQVDSIRREGPFTPDTVREESYVLTGQEDPRLLARIFEATYKLAVGKDRPPAVLCLAIRGDGTSEVPRAVLELLQNHRPPVTQRASCQDQGKRSRWFLTITSLKTAGDTVSAFSNVYVAPLWASWWHCRIARNGDDWRVFFCSLRMVS